MQITFITVSLSILDIVRSNSCILYKNEPECNMQSRCEWNDSELKCICNSIISQDVIIIMDSSGSVEANGWETQKTFVQDLISTGIPLSSPIGVIQFASRAWIRYQFTDPQNRTLIHRTVQDLEYTRGWTYMKDAVHEAIYLFETQSTNPHRRLVLIIDGNPMPISQTPCDLTTDLNALGVDVMIIGVGASWSRGYIDCLVKRDEDIIGATGFTNDAFEILRNETDEFLCRDVSFLLTEIKPSLGDVNDHYVPFIEFYNDATDMDLTMYHFILSGTFNGDIRSIDIVRSVYGTNWPYGTYLVMFDNINDTNLDTPWCKDCICELIPPSSQLCNESIYISMRGAYQRSFADPDDWNVIVYDGSDSIQRQVMNVTYGKGSRDWITVAEGYTYVLQDIHSCSPLDGSCWKQSCTVYGTPGHELIECDQTCVDQNCHIGGDHNAICNETNGLCACTQPWCYNVHGIPSCNCVVPPVNCTIILNMETISGEASWEKTSDIDWSNTHGYPLWYEVRWYGFQNDTHEEIIGVTPLKERALTLFNMEYREQSIWPQEVRTLVDFVVHVTHPNATTNVEHEIHVSEWTGCQLWTPTLQPTYYPTIYPTLHPTYVPTINPTNNPTWQPTLHPTAYPTLPPSFQPTSHPTLLPTSQPTSQPTKQPNSQPTHNPTLIPTSYPTAYPTSQPTTPPTRTPTLQPTQHPTRSTAQPTNNPTSEETLFPSNNPTTIPPTESPTFRYNDLHLICFYNDDEMTEYMKFITLLEYAQIMQNAFLSSIEAVTYRSVHYDEGEINKYAPWRRAGISRCVFCNVLNIGVGDDCPIYDDIIHNSRIKSEYSAIGVLNIVADHAMDEYRDYLIDIITSDTLKDAFAENMNSALDGIHSRRRYLLSSQPQQVFQITEIKVVDELNYVQSTQNAQNEQEHNQNTDATQLMFTIGGVILAVSVVIGAVIFVYCYYCKKRRRQEPEQEGVECGENMNQKQNDNEGAMYNEEGIVNKVNETHGYHHGMDKITNEYNEQDNDKERGAILKNPFDEEYGEQSGSGSSADPFLDFEQRDADVVDYINKTPL